MERTPRKTLASDSVELLLNDLAGLGLEERPVLGDRKNIENAIKQAKAEDPAKNATKEIIIITDSEASTNAPTRRSSTKAEQLRGLTLALPNASSNADLSDIVLQFVSIILGTNRSRTLTKDGFAFLDALYRQLSDPEVFVVPLRTSRLRSTSDKEQIPVEDSRQARLDVVARLRKEVSNVSSNAQLAKMVADFGAVTNRSSGRTITKDGFGFLEGLAARLKTLQ